MRAALRAFMIPTLCDLFTNQGIIIGWYEKISDEFVQVSVSTKKGEFREGGQEESTGSELISRGQQRVHIIILARTRLD